jgi:putative intracellular protease/amidase
VKSRKPEGGIATYNSGPVDAGYIPCEPQITPQRKMYRMTRLLFPVLLLLVCSTQSAISQTPPRALILTSSRDYLYNKDKPAGYRLSELVQAWKVFRKAGFAIDFGSRNGGAAPADSTGFFASDTAAAAFLTDTAAQRALRNSIAIPGIKPEMYKLALFTGGHTALWDYLEDPLYIKIASAVYDSGGVVATIGHGAAVLLGMKLAGGKPILEGAHVTCTSDEEEDKDGFQYDIPYYLEASIRRGGAIHYRSAPHESNVMIEERLITGQNSESARETAVAAVDKWKEAAGR